MKAKTYTEAVYGALKNNVSPATVFSRLKEILKKNGHLSLYLVILAELKTLVEKDERAKVATLTIARESDVQKFTQEVTAFLEAEGLTEIEHVIDESIIGGYTIEGANKKIDHTYKKSLLTIYQALTA